MSRFGSLSLSLLLLLASALGGTTAVTIAPPTIGSGSGLPSGTVSVAVGALSNALATAVNGAMIVLSGTNTTRGKVPLVESDMYKTDWILTNKSNLRITGFGKTVLWNTNDGIALTIWDCNELEFEGIIFQGTKTNGSPDIYQNTGIATHGLVKCGGTNTNLRFKSCVFRDGNFFGFDAGTLASQEPQCITYFDDCTFINLGHTNYVSGSMDGGALFGHPYTLMRGCIFEGCNRGIEPYTPAIGIVGDHFFGAFNCQFRNSFTRGLAVTGGKAFHANVYVQNCLFFISNGCPRQATGHILLNQVNSARIVGNIFTNLWQAEHAINVGASGIANQKDVQITRNQFISCNLGVALGLTFGGRIQNNDFRYITNSAVWLYANDAIVSDNHFEDCGLNGTDVVNGNIGQPSTNCIIENNVFIRRTGGPALAWVSVTSVCQDWVVRNNISREYNGGPVSLLTDSGVNTIAINAFNQSGALVRRIAGAGNGNTNYTLLSHVPVTYIGMSNVNIAAIMQTTAGNLQTMKVYVTNDFTDTWGLNFSSVTNRWRFLGLQGGGTNAPTVLSNNTVLTLDIETEGTNALVKYTYHRPAK